MSNRGYNIHFDDEQTQFMLLNILAHDYIHDFGPNNGSGRKRLKDIIDDVTRLVNITNTTIGGKTKIADHKFINMRTPQIGDDSHILNAHKIHLNSHKTNSHKPNTNDKIRVLHDIIYSNSTISFQMEELIYNFKFELIGYLNFVSTSNTEILNNDNLLYSICKSFGIYEFYLSVDPDNQEYIIFLNHVFRLFLDLYFGYSVIHDNNTKNPLDTLLIDKNLDSKILSFLQKHIFSLHHFTGGEFSLKRKLDDIQSYASPNYWSETEDYSPNYWSETEDYSPHYWSETDDYSPHYWSETDDVPQPIQITGIIKNKKDKFNKRYFKLKHNMIQKLKNRKPLIDDQVKKKRKTETGEFDIIPIGEAEMEAAWKINRLVAKRVLKSCNICDYQGVIMQDFDNINNEFLKLQIQILYRIAFNANISTNKLYSGNLDDKLERGFEDILKEDRSLINKKVFIQKKFKDSDNTDWSQIQLNSTWTNILNKAISQNKLFVINNAVSDFPSLKLSPDLTYKLTENNTFCPASSIMDAMFQCSLSASKKRIEYGDMNFNIINNSSSFYHNGIVKINAKGTSKITATVTTQTLFPDGTLLNSVAKDIDLRTGRELQATVVYRSLVNTIYNIFSNLISSYPNGILTKNINTLLWNQLLLNDNLCTQILQKGSLKSCGDLFQEINSCCKGGAYNKLRYSNNSGEYYLDQVITNYNLNGNALRLGIANDRPSGLRTVFMLLFAKSSDINQMAIGGYSGPSSKYIALSTEYPVQSSPKNITTKFKLPTKTNAKTKKSK